MEKVCIYAHYFYISEKINIFHNILKFSFCAHYMTIFLNSSRSGIE